VPRTRRYFPSKQVYEIIFRARRGLPLPALEIIEVLILSALARTQRDNKITLCHHLWMGNHAHIICLGYDAECLVHFYQEVQKKITDALKQLLGLSHLNIWEGDALVAIIRDPDAVVNQIAYSYANPARANLVDTLEDYPGLSSWRDYLNASDSVDASIEHDVPWIRLPSIEKLFSRKLTQCQDRFIAEQLRSYAQKKHRLVVKPNAWMAVFGIDEPEEVARWNEKVRFALNEKEIVARERRAKNSEKVIGSRRLRSQEILREFIPKREKGEKRVFVISTTPELRMDFIHTVQEISRRCSLLYQKWKRGDFSVKWPPGVFRPCAPPTANLFGLF
jgi:hypothetical protein